MGEEERVLAPELAEERTDPIPVSADSLLPSSRNVGSDWTLGKRGLTRVSTVAITRSSY